MSESSPGFINAKPQSHKVISQRLSVLIYTENTTIALPSYRPFRNGTWNGFETDLKRRKSGGEKTL